MTSRPSIKVLITGMWSLYLAVIAPASAMGVKSVGTALGSSTALALLHFLVLGGGFFLAVL